MLDAIKSRFLRDGGRVVHIPISSIYPNPAQPRKVFNKEDLRELSDSIRENGLIQPITVRRGNERGCFLLVAGERRLRASALAGLKDIPCIVSDIDDEKSSLIALVENLQRCDLSFFEEAAGIANLIRTYGFSQEEAARKLGKSQSAVSNKLRLLKLSPEVMKKISAHGLTERHARALLRLDTPEEQLAVLELIISRGMTVADTDRYIDKYLIGENTPPKKKGFKTYAFRDLRIFINTINSAVDTMRSSGIQAEVDKSEDENTIRMTICIPKNVPRET